jgi:hypothetical protein
MRRTAIKMKIKADEANRARREEAHKMAQEYFYMELIPKIEDRAADGAYHLISARLADSEMENFVFTMIKQNGFKLEVSDIYNYTISWKEAGYNDENSF